MNILIVTPIFPPVIGGPATYTRELAQHLSSVHPTTVLTFAPAANYPIISIKTIPLYASLPSIFGFICRQTHLLLNLFILIPRHQVIYIQDPVVVGFASVIISRFFRKIVILKFVGDIVWETARNSHHTNHTLENFYQSPLTFTSKLLNFFQEFSLNHTHHVITPSVYLKNFLHTSHHLPLKKIKVINNAIAVSQPQVNKRPHQLIFVGRLVSWKNVDHIIQAVHLARKKHPWKLIIIGDGPMAVQLHTLVAQLKASSWIKFMGKLSVSQTHKHIAQSQKLILYSDYEGQSHTLIEAMLLNTQVICSDIAPNREVTFNKASYVSLHNIKLLSLAINFSSKQSHKTYRLAHARYAWSLHIKKLLKLCN